MENQNNNNEQELLEIAKKRVKFKEELGRYIAINSVIWLIWLFTNHEDYEYNHIPWPSYCTIGWGVGLVFSYIKAYKTSTKDAIENEMNRMKNKY